MPPAHTPDTYATINAACSQFGFSRSTFYRMLADSTSGLREILSRIPPGSGRIRVPLQAFEAWLLRRGSCARSCRRKQA